MFDRRLVTDLALAALIGVPTALPASQGMRSAIVQSASPDTARSGSALAYTGPGTPSVDLRGFR